jgi:uncharacterized protein YbjT (DUF2867 family)
MASELSIVTGAFGYSGSHIARTLLERGMRVRTLTNHPQTDHPLAKRIEVAPMDFDRPVDLARSLEGANTLFNTYWIRFPHRGLDFAYAVKNSRTLIDAARTAGVRRIVQVSITNADANSPLPYFSGQGIVESYLATSGISHAIVRPAIIFGPGDILINNIAWILRRLPVFAIPGSGDYRLRPVFVEDLAQISVDAADEKRNPARISAIDAVGPEIFTFNELVGSIARAVGSRAGIIHLNPAIALLAARFIGLVTRDVTLTKDEIRGLMADLLMTQGPATAPAKLSEWLGTHATEIGARYASELARR